MIILIVNMITQGMEMIMMIIMMVVVMTVMLAIVVMMTTMKMGKCGGAGSMLRCRATSTWGLPLARAMHPLVINVMTVMLTMMMMMMMIFACCEC